MNRESGLRSKRRGAFARATRYHNGRKDTRNGRSARGTMTTIRDRRPDLDRPPLHMRLARWHLGRGMTPEVVPREYAIRSVPLIRNTERLSLERERETFFLVRELPLLLTLRHLASRFTLDIPDLPILSFFIQKYRKYPCKKISSNSQNWRSYGCLKFGVQGLYNG